VRYPAWLLALLACAAGSVVLGPGCFNSSEGQPCSLLGENEGDNECKNGLVCTAHSQLNSSGYTKDVCCPTDRMQATTVICELPANPVADAAPPPDVGVPVDSAPPDAEADTSPTVDSATDAAKDAPADANAPSDAKGDGGG
jgi:hypothetical protein